MGPSCPQLIHHTGLLELLGLHNEVYIMVVKKFQKKKERVVGLSALGHWAAGLGSGRRRLQGPRRELLKSQKTAGGTGPSAWTQQRLLGEEEDLSGSFIVACPKRHQPSPHPNPELCVDSQTHLTCRPYFFVLPHR